MSSVPSNPESSSRLSTPPVAVLKARPISSLRVSGKTHSPELAPPALGPGEGGGAVVLKGTASEASRNLALGVVAALAAVPIGGVAFWWAPKESFVAMATAVVVGLSLFLAFQLRLLLQRNGIFLLLAGAFTLTLFVPIGVRLMETGSEMAQTFSEFKHQQFQQTAQPSPSPIAFGANPTAQFSPSNATVPSPVTLSASALEKSAETQPVSRPEKKESEPAKIEVQQKPEPQFADEDPLMRATRLAKDEAIRLYPALQNTGTREHTLYLDAYNELTRARKFDFFKDPKWPLKIAEMLAAREGWVRSDAKPAPTAPAKSILPGSEISLSAPYAAPAPVAAASSAPVAAAAPAALGAPEVVGASAQPADPAEEAVNKAMLEARRRYPAIGREGSPENKAYLEAYQDFDSRKTDFFDRQDWPLRLVELVAKQEGWKRAEGDSGADAGAGTKISGAKEPPLPQ